MSLINRKSYLAEMRSLLAFMAPEDRIRVLHHFDAMFEEAGPDGEETLARCLGSPVRQVLQIDREYREAREKGETFYPETTSPVPEVPSAAVTEPVAESQPTFEEVFAAPAAVIPEPEQAAVPAEPQETAAPEERPDDRLENALVEVFQQEPEEIRPAEPEVPATEEIPAEIPVEQEEPLPPVGPEKTLDEEEEDEEEEDEDEGPGAGRVIAAILVTIPMLVVWAAVLAVFLAVGAAALGLGLSIGAAGVYLGSYVFSGTIAFMPDMMLVAGAALTCFCLALLLVWMGLWLVITGFVLVVRLARSVYRGILKKKKEDGDHE